MKSKIMDGDTLALLALSEGADDEVQSKRTHGAAYRPNPEDVVGSGDTVRIRTGGLTGTPTLDELRHLSTKIRRERKQDTATKK